MVNFDNVMTKFIINKRTDAKTDVIMISTTRHASSAILESSKTLGTRFVSACTKIWNAGMPELRNAGILKPGTQNY